MFQAAVPSSCVFGGDWSDLGGFPPSYYYGGDDCARTLNTETQEWCRDTFGYSPLVRWGSDANDEGSERWTGAKAWIADFRAEKDALAFDLRWTRTNPAFAALQQQNTFPCS